MQFFLGDSMKRSDTSLCPDGQGEARFLHRDVRSAFAAALLVLSGALVVPHAAEARDRQVAARYDIAFAGVNIGRFDFKSKIEGRRYEVVTGAKVKVLFGAFRWASASVTTGAIQKTAVPEKFEFNFSLKKKSKRSVLEFARGQVVKLDNQPPERYGAKHVPIRQEHLVDVVDPMTAVFQMSTIGDGDPCRKNLEIFDGRKRMRLTLSPKGKRRIADPRPTGQPGFGFVCRVKFTPVAGHKREADVSYIEKNDGIEVVLRPINGANFAIPYQIRVPTMVGSVTITARKVNITEPGRRIVLSN